MLTKIVLCILLGWGTVQAAQSDLQSKIARLQSVPKAERFKLMNEIKRELARMNAAQRNRTLGKLRASMHAQEKQHGMKEGMHEGMHGTQKMGEGMHGRVPAEHIRQNMQNRPEIIRHHPSRIPSPVRNGNENHPAPRPEPQQPQKHIPIPGHGR